MFLKARQWLRMMLLALAAQIGTLAKIGIRKELRPAKNGIKQEFDPSLRGQSGLPLDNLTKYRLGLNGKFEPATNLETVNLFGHSTIEELEAPATKNVRNECCIG